MHVVLAEVSADVPERGGFDAVFRAEIVGVTRVAYLVVRSRPVAEELAQEAFLRLYDHFDEVDNPAGFLRTVVVRLGSTWRSRHHMERERIALVADARPIDDGVAGFDIDETWEALGRLDPNRAAVLVLRFYEDLSHAEIGQIVGASAATVRSRTRRALHDLRKELER
jgi:RNA polymerase sigma factor (sigma-70 family)